MYIYMHVCACVFIYIHTCVGIYIYAYKHTYIYVCTYTYISTLTHLLTHTHLALKSKGEPSVAVCCSVLQCVAVCCSHMLQCVVLCWSALQLYANTVIPRLVVTPEGESNSRSTAKQLSLWQDGT